MQLQGKLVEIFATQEVSEKFSKREFVVEYAENPSYPEYIKLEVVNDKVSILDNYKVGDSVDVAFNLRGRSWTDKTGKVSYFNTLVAWKISKADGKASMQEVDLANDADDLGDGMPF
jgi:single-stranded DNA-binding protein